MKRMTFSFSQEPRGSRYETVLEIGLYHSETLGLIVQKWRDYPSSAQEVLERLSPYLIEKRDVSEWPGSRLAPGYTEQLRTYRFERPVKSYMQFVADGLFDWENPDLPDDPHLLRSDGSTWLGCIAHEQDAWLELTAVEYAELRESAPDLAAILTGSSETG